MLSHGPILVGLSCWQARKLAVDMSLLPRFLLSRGWVPLLLVLVGVVLGPASGAAQTVGCVPNTANYPCVYVANEINDSVSVINAVTNTVIADVFVNGKLPLGLVVTPDNALAYVANGGSSNVAVIETQTNSLIATVTLQGSPSQIAITPDGAYAYVAEPYMTSLIEVIDTKSNPPAVVGTLTGLFDPTAIAFSPDGHHAYVANPDSSLCAQGEECVEVLDTSTPAKPVLESTISIPGTSSGVQPASIAVTADGSLVCMSIEVFHDGGNTLGVAFVATSNNAVALLDLKVASDATNYGLGVTPGGILYAAEPGTSDAALNTVAVINTTPPALLNTITVGLGPTGVAVSPDGTSVYITNANDGTVSVINTGNPGLVTVGTSPQGVAVMPTILPAITIQPGSQAINYGQTATLSVVATGTAPLSYQWYQGQSGDMSLPIAGAVGSSYTTPALTSTTSYWVLVSNLAGRVSSNTATVTVITNPPTITTQPASQTINYNQMATLSVVATGTAPLSYQWYEGQSGDTSLLIAGAEGSSYTTPALTSTTSYWVLVGNVAGRVNSNTATVTVGTNRPPTCTLSLQEYLPAIFANPYYVTGIADCVDPQSESMTISINWGDSSPNSTGSGTPLIAHHQYAKPVQLKTYPVTVTATDKSGLQGEAPFSLALVPTSLAPQPVFAGQSSSVTVSLASPNGVPVLVAFECTTVTDSTGTVHQASDLGISCSSSPPTIILSSVARDVTLVISTTGAASGSLMPKMRQRTWFYACWLSLPALGFLAIGYGTARARRCGLSPYLALATMVVLVLLSSSCGGGFTAPKAINATPAGNYQVTVVDIPEQSTTGFVQTSLIVPLSVIPTP